MRAFEPVFAVWWLSGLASASAEVLSSEQPRQVIRSFQESYSSLASVRVVGSANEHFSVGSSQAIPISKDFVVAYDRAQSRWRYSVDVFMNGSKSGEPSQKVDQISDGSTLLFVLSEGKHVEATGFLKGQTAFLTKVRAEGFAPSIVFGYLPGIGDLSELVVGDSSLVVGSETLGGTDLVQISGKSAAWQFAFGFDPKRRFSLRTVVFKRPEEHLNPGDVVECSVKVETLLEKDGYYFPTKYRFDVLEAGGVPSLPSEGKGINVTPVVRTIPECRMVSDVELTEVDLVKSWAARDFCPHIQVPDATQVIMADAPQLNYKLVDGKVLPGLSPEAVAAAQRARGELPPSPSSPISAWVAGPVLAFACIVAIVFWRRRANHQRT